MEEKKLELNVDERAEMDNAIDGVHLAESQLASLMIQRANLEGEIANAVSQVSRARGDVNGRAGVIARVHGLQKDQDARYDSKNGVFLYKQPPKLEKK